MKKVAVISWQQASLYDLCKLPTENCPLKIYFPSPTNNLLLSTFSTIILSVKSLVMVANGADTTSSPLFKPDNICILVSSCIPVVTCTCFTLPALYTNTYSFTGAIILGLLLSSPCFCGSAAAFFSSRVVTD